MKLVDILARELKVWPQGLECLSQIEWNGSVINGKGFDGRVFDWTEIADETVRGGVIVTRAEWQAAVDALNAGKVVEWGKGSLPPIGSVVEWDGCTFAPEEPKEKDLRVGDQVTIIAHLKDGDFEIAAFTFNPKIHNPARGSVWVNQGAYGCFRPIRTPEQIAAEERETQDNEIMSRYFALSDCEKGILGACPERVIIGLMRVMGYRKQVTK